MKNPVQTWGENFQKVIAGASEAQLQVHGIWWPINDFELDCGLLRIDVMGKLQVKHMSDCEYIKVDGTQYTLDDVYE